MDNKISRNGQAALTYADKFKWLVIPLQSMQSGLCSCGKEGCKSPGKHPRTSNGVKAATTIHNTLQTWWGRWPGANVGIATGKKSGILVIDVDKHGDDGMESLKAKEAEIGKLPDTVTQHTGGRGLQLFFKYPNQKIKNGVSILPGVDIRSDDGYVVVPPSNHKSGGTYTWKAGHGPGEKELAELPQAWVDLLTCGRTGKKEKQTIGNIIPEGKRNDELFRLGCGFRTKGLGETEILAAVQAINTTRCVPALTDDELDKLVKSIMQYEPGINEEADPADDDYNSVYRYTPYRVHKGHLKQVTKRNGDGTEEYKEIANFVAVPLMDITKDDGKNRERYFTIGGRLADGTPLEAVTVSSGKFLSMGWITEHWGLDAIVSPANGTEKALRNAIQLLAKEKTQRKTIYIHTGWRNIQGKWAYLYHGGAIGADNISVELEGALTRYTLPGPVIDYREAALMSLKTLDIAPLEVTLPLLALTYLTPLNEFFRQAECEPAFTLWLVGKSGARKSTIASIFLSHFGSFSETSLPFSFRDTQNSLEKVGFLLKDMLMVVDDYHPSGTRQEKQRMEATAQALMRQYGDRRGRGRMTNDTSLKEAFIPRGNAIITSEDTPNVGQSGTARYIAVEVNKDQVNMQALSLIQDNKQLLAVSMRGFIEWIITTYIEGFHEINNGIGKDFPDFLGRLFKTRRQSAFEGAFHGRAHGQAVWLYIGLVLALDYFKDVGAITAEQDADLLAKGESILLKVVSNQDETTREDSPATLFLKALEELIATQKYRLWALEQNTRDVDGSNIGGYYNNDYVYLFPESCYGDVCQFYSKSGLAFPVSRKTLFKHLADEGHIRTQTEGTRVRYDPVKNVYGTYKRLLWVKRESLPIA